MAVSEWARRLWYLLNRRRFEAALRAEMEAHREALPDPRRFGNVLRQREAAADVWGWRWVDDAINDTRFALRGLRRAPGATIAMVLTLALATGATTGIFGVVNGVILRPLPFAAPDRLVQVYGRNWSEDSGATPDPIDGPVAPAELEAYSQAATIESLAAYDVRTVHFAGRDGVERAPAAMVEPALFVLLGVEPLVGRPFRASDGDVAVISEALWRSRFAADPAITGRVVTIDDRPRTVLGVMPDAFQFPYRAASMILQTALPESRTDAWLPMEPLRATAGAPLRRGRSKVIGRLKPGVTMAAAQAELAVLAARAQAQLADPKARIGVRLAPLADVVVGPIRRSLWMLMAAVTLVLLAACANVANLLLARMAVRIREVVTRAALGAGRLRLVRQFLAEGLLLGLAGGALGAFVARWTTGLLLTLGAARIPRAHEVALDWSAFLFLLGVCVSAAVLFGLAPAWAAARVDVRSATGEAGGRATMSRGYAQLRDSLVVVEVALAFLLATGAALVMREAARLAATPSGLPDAQVLTLHVTPRATGPEYEAIAARVSALPGVVGAGLIQLTPLQNWGWEAGFEVRGRPSAQRQVTDLRYVTAGYFQALGIPILRGRGFLPTDVAGTTPVVVINDALARRYFPGENPVGRLLDRGLIVGVAADVRQVSLDRPAIPELYYPVAQNVATTSDAGMSLLVRTEAPPAGMTAAVRAAVREVNPRLAIFNVRTLMQVRADSLSELHLYRWLIGLFAALTLVLAAIGLYGVMVYHAASRQHEFAVRLALGSGTGQVTRLVFGRGLRLTAIGLAAGLGATLAVTPVLRSVSAALSGDARTYAVVTAVLVGIALVACAVPAWRVSQLSPMDALRHD
jgi:putative ABC transport system permease protein